MDSESISAPNESPHTRRIHRLETPRLLLRSWKPSDASLLRHAIELSDAHLRPFIPFMRHEPRTLDETRQWLGAIENHFLRDEHYRFAIFDRAAAAAGSQCLLGEVMLMQRELGKDPPNELGYWLHVDHVGHGYATEAATALCVAAFEHYRCRRIELCCESANHGSIRLARRLSFVQCGSKPSETVRGEACELEVWQLTVENAAGLPAVSVSAQDALGELVFTRGAERHTERELGTGARNENAE